MNDELRNVITIAALRQLLTYVDDVERQGWYYGNKEQFCKRHDKIKEWLNKELDKLAKVKRAKQQLDELVKTARGER